MEDSKALDDLGSVLEDLDLANRWKQSLKLPLLRRGNRADSLSPP